MKHFTIGRTALALLATGVLFLSLVPVASAGGATSESQTAPSNPLASLPITGTAPAIGGTFVGTFSGSEFVVQNGAIVATGTLSGTLTNATGNVVLTVTNLPVSLPVSLSATCGNPLQLTLGPDDLTLLGLQVQLNQVVEEVTSPAGLICASAHVSDTNAPPQALVALLNHLLTQSG